MVSRRSLGKTLKNTIPTLKHSAQIAAEVAMTAKTTAAATAHTARKQAKQQLDQVLLNLQHKGINLKDSQDLMLRLGLNVLKRAESIRSQVAANPLAPAWIKEMSLIPKDSVESHADSSAPFASGSVASTPSSKSEVKSKTKSKTKKSVAELVAEETSGGQSLLDLELSQDGKTEAWEQSIEVVAMRSAAEDETVPKKTKGKMAAKAAKLGSKSDAAKAAKTKSTKSTKARSSHLN